MNTTEISNAWRGIALSGAGLERNIFLETIWTVTQTFNEWQSQWVKTFWNYRNCLSEKKSIQNIRKTTFNFWKNTQEVTTAQCHGTGTLQRKSRRNAFKQLSIQTPPPQTHDKWLVIVINNHGGFTTYRKHTEFKQHYALYPTANCNIWTFGIAAVPVYTHSLVTGTANIIPLAIVNSLHYSCGCLITSPPWSCFLYLFHWQ